MRMSRLSEIPDCWHKAQESPHFDRHITAAWLAVTLWDAPCCSSRAVSLPRAIESTCPDRKRRSATGRHSILLRWNHEIKMRGCLSPPPPPSVQTGDMGNSCSETWVTLLRPELAGLR